jgi:hypothetical protein
MFQTLPLNITTNSRYGENQSSGTYLLIHILNKIYILNKN